MNGYVAYGTGRRKTSVARVYLKDGNGQISVNKRPIESYFGRQDHVVIAQQSLTVTDALGKYDVVITVNGGGLSGQAGAIRHGLARALSSIDQANYSVLKANGFLTRDPRMVERKKYGQRGARRKFQFSKR